jgi:serine/threonine protein kinase
MSIETRPALSPADLVQSLKQAWRDGAPPDAAGILHEHQELLAHKSLVIDLAYEEYCLREQAGRTPETEAFVRELPAFRSEIREVIRGHRALGDHPELFDPADTHWPEPGESVEGFAVVRELGRGAFARAYLAEDPATGGRPVVIKLSPMPSGEAKTLGPIRHPHVAEVLSARRTNGLSVLCLRYVGAATLRDVVAFAFDRAPAPPTARTILDAIDRLGAGLPAVDSVTSVFRPRASYADAVAAIAIRLSDALAYLHGRGITHGDLKPSNILLGPGGHPYLIDFNLAGPVDDSLPRFGGTLPYMAPERIRHLLNQPTNPAPADRADVYAFGAVLFEAITGTVPFEPMQSVDLKAIAADLLARQLAGAPRPTIATVPGPVARLVARCLDPDPLRRPSAISFRRELERFTRRRSRKAWISASVIAVLGTGAAAASYATRPPAPEPERTPPTIVVVAPAEPTTPEQFIARGLTSLDAGDQRAAAIDFRKAYQLRQDGRSAAMLGYAQSRSGHHADAVDLYRAAVSQYDLREAWIFNNLAYALWHESPTVRELDIAIDYATAALELNQGLAAAHLNRAMARYHRDFDPRTSTLRDPEPCVADILAGLENAPRSIDIHFKAAGILSAAGPVHYDRAVTCLRRAVELGYPNTGLAQNRAFRNRLTDRADFGEILTLAPGTIAADNTNPFLAHPSP